MEEQIRYFLDLDRNEAKERLLKSVSYFDMELPRYFNFEPVLSYAYECASTLTHKEINAWKPERYDNLNYTLMSNKDGAIAWRPFELINPLIFGKCVELLTSEKNWELIVKRFEEFSDGRVECCSIPVIAEEPDKSKKEQILNWWKKVEQRSLELSLEYSHCKITDVSNCYPSIYTHAIGWAIHGREVAKKDRSDKHLLGNQLDRLIRNSREGQTNGIPQASLLSHILAELVLGYCDLGINEKIEQFNNVRVLRYRDDYRIFGMSDTDCAAVLKIISEELIKFGMKLGAAKTITEENLVVGAVKKDKIKALKLPKRQKTLQKELLIIHDFCVHNSDAGALKLLLSEFIGKLEGGRIVRSLRNENPNVLIAILMDIGAISPNVFPAVATASSIILNQLGVQKRNELFQLILAKTSRIPNNGYLEIWLQRIAVANKIEFLSKERMCQQIGSENNSIWNFVWIESKEIRDALDNYAVIDSLEIDTLKPYIERSEFDAFWKGYD